MKISKKGQYALISVVDLAIYAQDQHESIANIASRQNIDQRILGQIFFTLKKNGIINSIRGKNGGYFLSRNPQEITAGHVVRAIEGNLAPTKCCVNEHEASKCITFDSCFTFDLWQSLAFQINDTLDNITIDQLAKGYLKEINDEAT